MKKTLIAVAAAAALATSSAFAEVTFGAWLRTVFAPVASNGDKTYAGMANSWGGERTARLSTDWTSEDEKAGMKIDFRYQGGDLDMGDNQYMWVKPVDMIKVAFGNFDGGEFGIRENFCYGSWNWLRPNNWICGDEGLTFDGATDHGLFLEIKPIEGLTVYGNVPLDSKFTTEAKDVYRNAKVGAYYDIEGVGKIKAGWFGRYDKFKKVKAKAAEAAYWKDEDGDKLPNGTVTDYLAGLNAGYTYVAKKDAVDADKAAEYLGDIEVAFDLTAVENLYVTAGFKYSIADSYYWNRAFDKADEANDKLNEANAKLDEPVEGYLAWTPYTPNMKIALGTSYQVTDDFKVSASGAVFFYDYKDIDIDPRFQAGLGVDYSLGSVVEGLALAADVRYVSETKAKPKGEKKEGLKDDSISFMVGATKSIGSNGLIGIGFQGVTHAYGFVNCLKYYEDSKIDEGKFAWAVPVQVSISF